LLKRTCTEIVRTPTASPLLEELLDKQLDKQQYTITTITIVTNNNYCTKQ